MPTLAGMLGRELPNRGAGGAPPWSEVGWWPSRQRLGSIGAV